MSSCFRGNSGMRHGSVCLLQCSRSKWTEGRSIKVIDRYQKVQLLSQLQFGDDTVPVYESTEQPHCLV